jgi:hypothetical protein
VRDRITDAYLARELPGGQRLVAADLVRLVGAREGRVRQVLGPLGPPTATAPAARSGDRRWSRTAAGRPGWIGPPAATRTRDGSSPSLASRSKSPRSRPSAKAARSATSAWSWRSRPPAASTATTASSAAPYPAERSRLRGNPFAEPAPYRQDRELAEQAHQLASEVGLRQAARQLGIHRDALKAAFTQWGLPALQRRVGWQPNRFLSDRAEAERAFALAERLGSINGAA